jgi:SMODS and SLOG-associating 2TM effector domain family 4
VNQDLAPILATSRELYGRVVWTHKVHEKEREIFERQSCLDEPREHHTHRHTTVFAVISASLQPLWALIVTAISAAAAVCFAVWQASADPASNEAKHRVTAKELLWIREQLLLFIASCQAASPPPDAQRQLDMLTRELTAVYKFAPDTSPEAYAAADKMLKSGHFIFSDDEIDGFLPVDLRKKKL